MSQSTAKGKLIGRFTIGFDDETKASISDLKTKLDAVPHRLEFGNIMPIGGLLAAMQGHAVNDSNGVVHHGENVKPELKQLGQWVFEGQDEKWISASVDEDGTGVLHNDPKEILEHDIGQWYGGREYKRLVGVVFDTTDWMTSAISRETINDVEYLSSKGLEETVPHIDDVLALPNWLSDSTPQITQADLQLIFVQNLATTLIQRMHSINRFSEDDYAIGGNALVAWDILVNLNGDFGIAIGSLVHHESALLNRVRIARFHKSQCTTFTSKIICPDWRYEDQNTWHTITEAELPAFRAALEACYA